MKKLNATDQIYLKLAQKSPEKAIEVRDYYRNCLKISLARNDQESAKRYKYMLVKIREVINDFKPLWI